MLRKSAVRRRPVRLPRTKTDSKVRRTFSWAVLPVQVRALVFHFAGKRTSHLCFANLPSVGAPFGCLGPRPIRRFAEPSHGRSCLFRFEPSCSIKRSKMRSRWDLIFDGAGKRTRTSMKLLSHGPEPCASANSAMPARQRLYYYIRLKISRGS